MISYNKLWKLLIDKGLNKKELIKLTGISSSSIAKMTKGQNVTTDVQKKSAKLLIVTLEILWNTFQNKK